MSATELQPAAVRPRCHWQQHSRRSLPVVVLLLAIGTNMVIVGMRVARGADEAGRLQATRESFGLTAWSLRYYNKCHGHLPYPVRRETVGKPTRLGTPNGTGKPLYSWRAEVCRYRDNWCQEVLDTSAPWDAATNRRFADFPWQFCYDALVTWDFPKAYSKTTSMMAITGPGTAFGCEGEPPKSLKSIPRSTIVVVEVRNSGVHWMQPGDFDIRTMPRTINAADGRGISSRYPGGFHVLFADLEVWFLSDKVPFETLKRFFTLEGAKRNDREKDLGPYILWRPPAQRPLSAAYHLDDLQQVRFDDQVTDADLADLKASQFAPMKTLWLGDTQVTGPGLANLRGLAHLETLMLDATPVTDDGLAYLADVRQLTWLRLNKTGITDKGLKHLRHLTNLKGLELDDTKVTDAGLKYLKAMTRLEWLTVAGTSITDAGVEHLAGLTELKTLSLLGTKVTGEGVKRLRHALPHCDISDSQHCPGTEMRYFSTPSPSSDRKR